MTTRYDPVVFDLDGTLLDSGPTIVKAIELACLRRGIDIPADADLTGCVGPPLELALPRALGPLDDLDALIEEYRSIYRPLAVAQTRAMEGAVETLSMLREAAVRIAVATYKPTELAVTLLRATGMISLIDLCRGRQSTNDRRDKKAILLGVLGEMSPHGAEPLYVGDHAEDSQAARAARVDFVPFTGPESWREISAAVFDGLHGQDDGSHHDAAAR